MRPSWNYYNPKDAVRLPQKSMEEWPKFAISILQFEQSTTPIAEVIHNILYAQSILDIMYQIHYDCRGGNSTF